MKHFLPLFQDLDYKISIACTEAEPLLQCLAHPSVCVGQGCLTAWAREGSGGAVERFGFQRDIPYPRGKGRLLCPGRASREQQKRRRLLPCLVFNPAASSPLLCQESRRSWCFELSCNERVPLHFTLPTLTFCLL